MGTFNMRWCVDGTDDYGAVWALENTSLVRPVKTISTVTPYGTYERRRIPADGVGVLPTKVFDAIDNQYAFQFLALQLVNGAGFVHVAWMVDKPTSSVNLAPAGTHQRVCEQDLSCHTPLILNTAFARVHPTLSVAAGMSGGFPTVLTDAGTVEGRVYQVFIKNQSTTTDVYVDLWVRN